MPPQLKENDEDLYNLIIGVIDDIEDLREVKESCTANVQREFDTTLERLLLCVDYLNIRNIWLAHRVLEPPVRFGESLHPLNAS